MQTEIKIKEGIVIFDTLLIFVSIPVLRGI